MNASLGGLTELLIDRISRVELDVTQQWVKPAGTSTRHFVIDNLLDDETCSAIYEAFPKSGEGFFTRESFREKKRTSANLKDYDSLLGKIDLSGFLEPISSRNAGSGC